MVPNEIIVQSTWPNALTYFQLLLIQGQLILGITLTAHGVGDVGHVGCIVCTNEPQILLFLS